MEAISSSRHPGSSRRSKEDKEMEQWLNTETYECKQGWRNYVVISSFVARVEDDVNSGTVRIPCGFHERHGRCTGERIKIICCEGFKYRCRYNTFEGKFVGLERFFKDHRVTQNSLITIDFTGKRCFLARVYRPIGMEANYNWISPKRCQTFKDSIDSIKQINTSVDKMVEEEKEMALFKFNVKHEDVKYYELDLNDLDHCQYIYTLQIKDDIHGFWEKWKTGDEIRLKFEKKVWNIEFTKNQRIISLGQGWFDFCQDAALKQGDKLVFSRCRDNPELLVCVLKKIELQLIEESIGSGDRGVSFWQQTHELLMSKGTMVPPLMVTKYYEEQLKSVENILCGGKKWQIKYEPDIKMLSGFLPILKEYNVKRADHIFISVGHQGETSMKIFRRDGMEIKYSKSVEGAGTTGKLVLEARAENVQIIDLSDNDAEDTEMTAQQQIHQTCFTEIMQGSHVDGRAHGVYLPKIFESAEINLKQGSAVVFNKQDCSWQVGIIETNNRIRFCKGWNAFVRDNEIEKGDTVSFRLQQDRVSFEIEIKHVRKRQSKKQS